MKVTLDPEQIVLPGFAAMITVGATADVTVIVISLDVAVAGLAQAALLVITHVILLPLAKAAF